MIVVSGKTENRKSLETYVQGYYLDLILVAGTKRLLQMTMIDIDLLDVMKNQKVEDFKD